MSGFGALRLVRAIVAVSGLGGVALGAIVATAVPAGAHAGNSDPNVVHACVNNSNGLIRIVAVNGTCFSGPASSRHAEHALHWAIVGPKGDKGDQGAEGPPGPEGPPGNQPAGPQIYKAFLNIQEVPGSSTDARHAHQIDLLDVRFSLSNVVTQPLDGTQSNMTISRVTVMKMVDAATAALLTNTTGGPFFRSAVIQICRVGANPVCFLEYSLNESRAFSVTPGVVEKVSLSFFDLTQKFFVVNPATGAISSVVSGVIHLSDGGTVGQPSIPSTLGDNRFDATDGVQIFARFDDIVGGSTNNQHQGWMDVTSLIGGSVVAPTTAGSSTTFSPITLIKAIDQASPVIFQRAASGLKGRVFIDICAPKAGGGLACNVNYTLDNVGVSGISTDVSLEGANESVSLLYGRITQTITDGTNQTRFCWDLFRNTGC